MTFFAKNMFFFKKKIFNNKLSTKRISSYHKKKRRSKRFVKSVLKDSLHGVLRKVYNSNFFLIEDLLGILKIVQLEKGLNLRYFFTSNNLFFKEPQVNFISLKKNKIVPGYVGHNLIVLKHRIAGAFKTKTVFLKKKGNYSVWLLPSGQKKEVVKFTSIEKGVSNFTKTPMKHIKVRGLAKNPVDHPNGGSSRHSFSKTPWGKKAKRSK